MIRDFEVDRLLREMVMRAGHALNRGQIVASELIGSNVEHLPECEIHTKRAFECTCARLLVLMGAKGERIEIDVKGGVRRATRN